MPKGRKQAAKREQALAALLTEPTLQQAAAKVGIDEKTIRNWLREPEFLGAYREARRQIVEAAVADLQKAASEAVATLKCCLAAERPSDRIKAAVAVLDRAIKGVELIDLEARVVEIERRLPPRKGTP